MSDDTDFEPDFADEPRPPKARPEAAEFSATRPSAPDKLAQIERRLAASELAAELGCSRAHAERVIELQRTSPSLTPREASNVVAARQPGTGTSAFDPGTHGSLGSTPQRNSAYQPGMTDEQAYVADMRFRAHRVRELQASNQVEADEIRNNMIGSLAARALGMPHHKIPLR
jgi:hypothetical protein